MQDKTNNSPRRYTTKQERLAHVENWKSSGLSMREYCRQNSLSLASLSAWKIALLQKSANFKPVKLLSAQDVPLKQGNVVDILIDQRIKIRLQNVTDATLVINIDKGLMRCN